MASSANADYHAPRSVDELTEKNVRAIAALEDEAQAARSRVACAVTRLVAFCGTLRFALLHAAWFGGWVLFNSLPGLPHIDPFPFTFLTLLVSLEAIFLSIFVLISQNDETRLAERRNALDLQINLLAEQENTKMLALLERIARKLDAEIDDDPALGVLEQATRPERLAAQIDRVTGGR